MPTFFVNSSFYVFCNFNLGTPLRTIISTSQSFLFQQHPVTDREEYENILKDLQDLIEPEEKVLVISFGCDFDETPGMLSEEKVYLLLLCLTGVYNQELMFAILCDS